MRESLEKLVAFAKDENVIARRTAEILDVGVNADLDQKTVILPH